MRRYTTLAVLALLSSFVPHPAFGEDQGYVSTLQQWRLQHAASLSTPDGWLAVVGLEWLKPGDNTFGTATDNSVRIAAQGSAHLGIIHVSQSDLELQAPVGGFPADFQVDGHAATNQKIVVDGPKPTQFTYGTLTFFVIRRGDQTALRIKDSQSPARLDFRGLHWYAPDPSYKIEAEWIPYDEPKRVGIQNVVGIVTPGLVPGVARFKIQDQTITLEPTVQSLTGNSLLFVIRDATSGKTTYAASRFLHAELPDHGLLKPGKILLDFNRLENPPCAFTPYATCPLPPASNKLKVALEVGELNYAH
ncbi:MAG: DUF1684 domain-containing protein [Terracidiphilus sp.]|nr:DUF1684 domain-containing protein [Terracidiphilus sp.]